MLMACQQIDLFNFAQTQAQLARRQAGAPAKEESSQDLVTSVGLVLGSVAGNRSVRISRGRRCGMCSGPPPPRCSTVSLQ